MIRARGTMAVVLALVGLPLVAGPETTGATAAHSRAGAPLPASEPEAAAAGNSAVTAAAPNGGRPQLAFEPNLGQTDESVDYLARASGYTLFLTGGDAVFDLSRPPGSEAVRGQSSVADDGENTPESESPAGAVVRMHLVNATTGSPGFGIDRLPGASSYLRGDNPSARHTGVPHYGAVRYSDVYPGVDAVYRSDADGQLEYDFHVAPGADPGAITLGFDGADDLRLDDGGAMLLDTAVGTLRQQAPFAYQPTPDGERQQVATRFVRRGEDQVGFELGAYDSNAPLVIDPVVVYSSFLGGFRRDEAFDVAADDDGNAYVTGLTQSAEFPTTTGAYDDTCETDGCGVTTDAFVTKLTTVSDGNDQAVAYSTYLGGGGNDQATGVAVDGEGAAYLTGHTTSDDFPTTPKGHDDACDGGADDPCDDSDAFVVKLNSSGSDLAYGTYLGGSEGDRGRDIAVDGTGHTYVTGDTGSADFPTTGGAYDRECGADDVDGCTDESGDVVRDAFVSKLAADGSSLAYSTYLGGGRKDRGRGIAVHDSHAYVTGDTAGDFPTTDGAFDQSCEPGRQHSRSTCNPFAVGNNAFVTKLPPDGSALQYSTYLGGGDVDMGHDIAVDEPAGHAYVTGDSSSNDFPTTERGFESGCGGDRCAFVTKLGPRGGGLGYSARFGSAPERDGEATAASIAVDGENRAHIAGWTGAERAQGFPVTDDAYRESCTGQGCGNGVHGDAFVAVLPRDGSAPEYATYLGGDDSDLDFARGIAVDPAGDVYVAGVTGSGDFPTMDSTQGSYGGNLDGFVVKLTRRPERPIVYGIDRARGPTSGGTDVTVTGRHLGEVTEMRFGDQPVPPSDFTVESDTTITATAPPVGPPATKPGTRMVTVTDDRGTSPPTSRARFHTYQGSWRAVPELTPPSEDTERSEHTATLLDDGRVLIAGGRKVRGTGVLDSVQLYDPGAETATVTDGPDMPTPRNRHTATRLDGPACDTDAPPDWCGDVLVAGGFAGAGTDSPALDSAEVYDPEAETWTATNEPMESARGSHTATRLPDGRVLIAGGLVSPRGQEVDTTEIYDPRTGEWSPAASLEHGRGKHTATALDDGRVLVVGGITLNDDGFPRIPRPEVYAADEEAGAWMSFERPYHFQHTATKLSDGQVLIAGGTTALTRSQYVDNVPTSLAWLSNPNASDQPAWQTTTSMGSAHRRAAAVRLADGRVLAVDEGDQLGSVETYEPGGNDPPWYASAPMLVDGLRSGGGMVNNVSDERPAPHTTTLLSAAPEEFVADPAVCGDQCGQVLVVGGTGDPPAELYTPAPSVSGIEPSSGGEGTDVTVTGAGFDEQTEVFFGQTRAQDVSVDSFGRLTAVAPAGAEGSDAQVTVRNPQGLDAAPQQFCYGGSCGGTGGTGDDTGDGTDQGADTSGQDTDDTAPAPQETQPAQAPGDDPDQAPGRVDDLAAEAQSSTEVEVSFSAVGADGDGQAPPAADYVVKQSTEPIDSEAAFNEAFTLCGEVCSFGPAAVGDPLSLTITDLEPETAYHYAVKARDPAGNLGERSNPASATTTTAAAGRGPASACDDEAVPASGFDDIAGSVHQGAIDCLAWYAITLGISDIDGDGQPEYGPQQPITRAQMATFLSRMAAEAGLDLPTDAPNAFGDDDRSIHAPRIDALAALGITHGKGDLDGDGRPDYAPGEPVARDQMASFLIRLHQRVTGTLPEAGQDRFGDDDGSVHEDNINALSALGVTQGKGDLDGDGRADYAPRNPVSRAQMASFLARELEQLVEAGAVHPGGAEVLLDDTEAAPGEALTGRVRSHRQIAGLIADGCGADEEVVGLNEQRAFTVAVPAEAPAGACELTLTATVQPVDPAAEGQQRVSYRFDVTVTE